MKKYLKLIVLLSVLFCVVNKTIAYFTTSSTLISDFNTEKYNFSLVANGGTFPNNSLVIRNNSVTLPSPIRKGYEFLFFSKKINGGNDFSTSINNVNDINNKTLYANWKLQTYSLTFDSSGGSLSTQKNSYTVEDEFTLPVPSKTGYEFIGWTGSNGNTPQKNVIINKGTVGNLNYKANWKIQTFTVDVNPIVQNITQNAGVDGFTFSVYLNNKLISDHVIDYYSDSIPYNSKLRIVVHNREGYNIKSFTDKTFAVTSNLTINPIWLDDIPPTIVNFEVKNLGLYDPIAGIKKGWNVSIYINAFDSGTGIKKYQTWLAPYGSGSGASRADGNFRELKNVLYLEEPSGRTFCAYAIDLAGNEASKCETIKV